MPQMPYMTPFELMSNSKREQVGKTGMIFWTLTLSLIMKWLWLFWFAGEADFQVARERRSFYSRSKGPLAWSELEKPPHLYSWLMAADSGRELLDAMSSWGIICAPHGNFSSLHLFSLLCSALPSLALKSLHLSPITPRPSLYFSPCMWNVTWVFVVVVVPSWP